MDQPESQPPRTRVVSGKLIILGILAVALLAAGISWVFRYNATHHAAGFWGSKAARLIRAISRDKDWHDEMSLAVESRFEEMVDFDSETEAIRAALA